MEHRPWRPSWSSVSRCRRSARHAAPSRAPKRFDIRSTFDDTRRRSAVNDALCNQAMWLTQTMLLGPKQDMDHVADALRKIQSQAASLNLPGIEAASVIQDFEYNIPASLLERNRN